MAEAEELRADIRKAETAAVRNDEELEKMRKKLNILEVQSRANLPEMERIHQMNVVPDVLPDLHPSIDVRLTVPSTLKQLREGQKVHAPVEPGAFVFPRQMFPMRKPSHLPPIYTGYVTANGPQYPYSVYPSPPSTWTPYHRYVLLLLPQSDPTKPLEIPIVADSDRLGFDTRSFLQQWGLDGAKGGGRTCSVKFGIRMYQRFILEYFVRAVEPKFGRPPKFDRYADVKKVKKYVNITTATLPLVDDHLDTIHFACASRIELRRTRPFRSTRLRTRRSAFARPAAVLVVHMTCYCIREDGQFLDIGSPTCSSYGEGRLNVGRSPFNKCNAGMYLRIAESFLPNDIVWNSRQLTGSHVA
ncbi:PEBP protein [Salix suchowensis]|nr:PEBP protein [Salix suchowensis]